MDNIPRPEREALEILRKKMQENRAMARELDAMQFPPVKWAVPGLIPEGLILLAGKPKMGKSWFALQLAEAVGGGGCAVGGIPVDVGPVLYLALEDNFRRLQSRQRIVLNGGVPAEYLEFCVQCPRLDAGGFQLIEEWLKAHPSARLVVVDTFQKIRPRHKVGAAYGDDYDAVERLKFLADTYNITILMVHHLRKMEADDPMDEITGSIGLTGAVDGSMVLKRERGKADAVLYITGRDVDDQELAMKFDMELCLWSIVGQAEEFLKTKERTEIAQVLRDCEPEPLTPKEIAEQTGKDVGGIKKMLRRMLDDNEVMTVGYGKYHLVKRVDPGKPGASSRPPEPKVSCEMGHAKGYYWHYRDSEWACKQCHGKAGKGGTP